MKAKYPGYCPLCHIRFVVGEDNIIKSGEKWVHEKCPTVSAMPSRVGTTYSTSRNETKYLNQPIDIEALPADSSMVDFSSAIEEAAKEETIEAPKFQPSQYQQDIFDFIQHGKGHGVIEAVAGSGKTTTIVKALDLTPKDAKVAFVAFNRHIAKELQKRAPQHVSVSTLHSLGLSNLRRSNPKIDIQQDKVGTLLDDFWPVSKLDLDEGRITKQQRKENFTKRLSMRNLVSICKSVLCDVTNVQEVNSIINRYGIELEEDYVDEIISKLPEVMARCIENSGIVDFDDMIWLPVVTNMKLEQFDFLMVDEAQDMNASQIQLILRSIKPDGRIIAVGDRNQSLYGFRGADCDAIPNLIEALKATTMPLSVTYRCPSSHVDLAKQLVPQLEARENAPVGVVAQMDYFDLAKNLVPGDMVICRTNAPLIKPAFECIRQGKKAIIRGKDIGEALINLIKRFETDDIGLFEVSLSEYFEREYTKLLNKGKEMQALLLQDKVETLRYILNECSTVTELKAKIDMLFNDNSVGIVFSSVHRAKGLEAEKVYILRPDLMPHPKAAKEWERQQELNCVYVAQTRSKDTLIMVQGGKDNV